MLKLSGGGDFVCRFCNLWFHTARWKVGQADDYHAGNGEGAGHLPQELYRGSPHQRGGYLAYN